MIQHLQTIGADVKRITMKTMRTLGKWFVDTVDGTDNPFDPDDFGHGFKARELINGKWVMMKDGEICSLVYPGLIVENPTGVPGSSGDRQTIERHAPDIMSAFGVLKPRK